MPSGARAWLSGQEMGLGPLLHPQGDGLRSSPRPLLWEEAALLATRLHGNVSVPQETHIRREKLI